MNFKRYESISITVSSSLSFVGTCIFKIAFTFPFDGFNSSLDSVCHTESILVFAILIFLGFNFRFTSLVLFRNFSKRLLCSLNVETRKLPITISTRSKFPNTFSIAR